VRSIAVLSSGVGALLLCAEEKRQEQVKKIVKKVQAIAQKAW